MAILGLPPLISAGAKVIVLGTLPGAKSLEIGEYYANPGNAFWVIMERLFGILATVPYPDRASRLSKKGIALWDVLSSADRVGSLDDEITNAVCNNFNGFLKLHSDVELVCFNGKAAAKLFDRLALPTLTSFDRLVKYETLPSTSPMHAVGLEQKLKRWAVIRDHLLASPR